MRDGAIAKRRSGTLTARPQPHVDGVRHDHVEARGLRFHVAEAGPGDADPVVLLHGWPQHWYEWRHLIAPLSQRYRVVCPDLRGFGWSDAPPGGYDKETLTEDVVALLDAMGLERVRLIGHDWGGWVGFLLCLMHPERVERYVALNIPHPWQRREPRNVLSLWRLWYQAVIASPVLGPRAVARLAGLDDEGARRFDLGVWDAAERRAFLGQFEDPARARASTQLYRSFLLVDLPRMTAGRYARMRLRTPTLMLFGTRDKVIPAHQVEGFEAHADDMRLERIPGVGHFVADEVPELVAARALDHFEAGSPATSRT